MLTGVVVLLYIFTIHLQSVGKLKGVPCPHSHRHHDLALIWVCVCISSHVHGLVNPASTRNTNPTSKHVLQYCLRAAYDLLTSNMYFDGSDDMRNAICSVLLY